MLWSLLQASTWHTLASIISNLQETLETKSLSIDCLRDVRTCDDVFKSEWDAEGSELWRHMCERVQLHTDFLTIQRWVGMNFDK